MPIIRRNNLKRCPRLPKETPKETPQNAPPQATPQTITKKAPKTRYLIYQFPDIILHIFQSFSFPLFSSYSYAHSSNRSHLSFMSLLQLAIAKYILSFLSYLSFHLSLFAFVFPSVCFPLCTLPIPLYFKFPYFGMKIDWPRPRRFPNQLARDVEELAPSIALSCVHRFNSIIRLLFGTMGCSDLKCAFVTKHQTRYSKINDKWE